MSDHAILDLPTAVTQPAQRSLPLDELGPKPGAYIPRPKGIFCNRNLRMSNIAWVGFDMDYTLAIYNQAEMDRLSIDATITKLFGRGYPELIRDVEVPIDFAVRGLLIDKRFGHVLKMDRYKNVNKGFHGFRELTKEELRALYHTKKVRPATPRYHWIDTLYALSEAVTYTALVPPSRIAATQSTTRRSSPTSAPCSTASRIPSTTTGAGAAKPSSASSASSRTRLSR